MNVGAPLGPTEPRPEHSLKEDVDSLHRASAMKPFGFHWSAAAVPNTLSLTVKLQPRPFSYNTDHNQKL